MDSCCSIPGGLRYRRRAEGHVGCEGCWDAAGRLWSGILRRGVPADHGVPVRITSWCNRGRSAIGVKSIRAMSGSPPGQGRRASPRTQRNTKRAAQLDADTVQRKLRAGPLEEVRDEVEPLG